MVENLENKMESLIMESSTSRKNEEFINSLWKYVLFSKKEIRYGAVCKYCSKNMKLEYEGFGGLKKIGWGKMFFPDPSGKIYTVSDMVFHYLYEHDYEPTKFFTELVSYADSLSKEEYFNKISSEFFTCKLSEESSIKCEKCKLPAHKILLYQKGSTQQFVRRYSSNKSHNRIKSLFWRPKYVGVCNRCFQIVKY